MELLSRYGDKYNIEPIAENQYKFTLPKYTRILYGDEANTMIFAIDPPGGPMINVGEELEEGKIIREIISTDPQISSVILVTEESQV